MTRRNRMSVPIAAAVGGMITAAGLLAGPQAIAAPAQPDGSAFHKMATSQQARQQVRDYWTPQRMKAAKPFKAGPASNWKPSKVATGKPTVVAAHNNGRHRDPKADSLGGPWTGGGKVTETAGKVFMTLQGVDYVCSGDSVTSENKSLVVTAGHCVNEGPGDYVTNFEFVPGYHDGEAPYGEWSATAVETTDQWAEEGDFNYDVGFAIVGEENGQKLDDAVGSQSIGFNQERGQEAYSFGYPAESPYDGETLDYASGTTSDDSVGGSDDLSLKTDMTGGCSGGPWFFDFDESAGTGTQISVNSFGYTDQPDVMYGPYFGDVIQDTYNEVQAADVTA